jgi:predicted AlkP superfamily pyrophosphatase or phosphodiesterase
MLRGIVDWMRVGAMCLACAVATKAAPVLMISIDGMKPEYVTKADEHGLKLPTLRAILREGAHAEGVVGVWPTVTYPSHTTLVTGVWPAEHGIASNLQFDPLQSHDGAWYWYASQIKVPTLWTAAHKAGVKTASIGWPVSVGARDVDDLIPEFWRYYGANTQPNPEDRRLMAALARPETLFDELEPTAGPYMMGNDTRLEGDEAKTRYALAELQLHKPGLMTLHLSSLDEAEHEHGPFSAEADATLEAIDGMVGRLRAAALANDPDAVVVVVSDHGFETITHAVNLAIPFIKAGLVEVGVNADGKTPKLKDWTAEPWMSGGMAAVVVRDASNAETMARVHALLDALKRDPANGVAEVLDKKEIARRGGFPEAEYLIVFKPGYYTGAALAGELVTEIKGSRGSHGFTPEDPQMRASFFATGKGIAAGRDLGVVDMRRIAPTVAGLLGVTLPTAKAEALAVRP